MVNAERPGKRRIDTCGQQSRQPGDRGLTGDNGRIAFNTTC